jgi:hypothetical protein
MFTVSPKDAPTGTAITTINDKENYYNSSRRENLMPLNSYEYRNSYKDHYDNQGVRLNPAILKNLPSSSITTATNNVIENEANQFSNSMQQTSLVTSPNKHSILHQQPNIKFRLNSSSLSNVSTSLHQSVNTTILNSNKSILIKSATTSIKNCKTSDQQKTKVPASASNVLLDHTYKMVSNHERSFTSQIKPVSPNHTSSLNMMQSAVVNELISDNSSYADQIQEVQFLPGEFLIHKSTFSGDFENYDIWCVINEEYLQKYEPVLLSTGERCHQSADVVSYFSFLTLDGTQNKNI